MSSGIMSDEIANVLDGRIGWAIEGGDALSVLRSMPSESIHCVVTSPPYYGLRDYGMEPTIYGGSSECEHTWTQHDYYTMQSAGKSGAEAFSGAGADNAARVKAGRWRHDKTCAGCGAWCGQLGLEPTPDLYLEHMVEVFREVRRVLRADGTLWCNMGDSYAGSWGIVAPRGIKNKQRPQTEQGKRWERKAYGDTTHLPPTANVPGLKPKDLLMMPARLALALQADGWYLRSDIIWCKPNPMPESVTDRPTTAHEHIFLLAKAERYFYDAMAIAEPAGANTHSRGKGIYRKLLEEGEQFRTRGSRRSWAESTTAILSERNRRSVWTVPTRPFPGSHFATFPTEIPRCCILAGTSERGVCSVCDAPYRRVVEREKNPARNMEEQRTLYAASPSRVDGHIPGPGGLVDVTRTTGWQPTCAHTDAPTVPAVVLDPFGGAATTVMVALRLQRRAVAIELNPRYVEMGRQRVINDAPMFNLMPMQELTA